MYQIMKLRSKPCYMVLKLETPSDEVVYTTLLLMKVPDDFQRKKFDLDDLANWKATQYKCFLYYSSVACFRKILQKDMYDHFMLLFVDS